MTTLTVRSFGARESRREVFVSQLPDRCPRCDGFGAASVIAAIQTGSGLSERHDVIAICECDAVGCECVFIAYYALLVENGMESAQLMASKPLEYVAPPQFSDAIVKMSPTFYETYTQAARASENGLTQICGAGYRRALEFLVKDYALLRRAPLCDGDTARIARAPLGHCIGEFLPSAIQDAAKRAAWLGNDEVHYYRVWSDRDVMDLRALIDLTARAIDYQLDLDKYLQSMPDRPS